MSVWDTLRRVLGRRGLEREVAEEVESHLLHRVDDLVAEGHDPDEARRRAEAEFGDVARIRRQCASELERTVRLQGPGRVLDAVGHDLAWAWRQLRRGPGFALVAVATLALGIGATTTIVAVVDAVVLEPLPFHEPDRLVAVEETTPAGASFVASEPDFLDWRAGATGFSDMAAITTRSGILSGQAGEPRAVQVGWASASLLDVLGVQPLLGRGIRPDEDRPGGRAPVVVLSHEAWRERFGGDRNVVGSTVLLDGQAHTVVGVLPAGLSFLDRMDLLVPLGADPASDREEHYLDVYARLAPGRTLESAAQELGTVMAGVAERHPEIAGWGTRVRPVRDVLVGSDLTRAGWVLLAAAALLLLIACVNVTNLLLARATVRRGEVGVRVALGAGRGRIVRQLLTESAVLAAVGGALGMLITFLALPAVQSLGAGRIPRLDQAAISPAVLIACLASVSVAALAFGLAPAFDLRGSGPMGALRGAGRGGQAAGQGLRSAMVMGQIALSVMLLVGTGLLVRSFMRLAAVDPGFDARHALAVTVSMPDAVYDWTERPVMVDRMLGAVAAVPGVTAVGATAVDPFGGMNLANFAAREDRMPADARDFLPVAWRTVTPGFFRAMGVELREGRPFRADDGWKDTGTPVIVSASLAGELWPEGDALGSTLVWGDPSGSRLTIVGVVNDVQDVTAGADPPPIIYRAYRQIPWAVVTFIVRTRAGAAGQVPGAVHEALRRVAPTLAVPELHPLEANLDSAVAPRRFNAILLGTFAGAGLLLALVGVYGVTSFFVSRRVREIGIRLALGGEPSGIRRMVLVQSLRLAVAGTLLGGLGAWIAGRWIASLLYRTTPGDALTWVAVPLILLAATMVAAWVPSLRATRVNPRDALAAE